MLESRKILRTLHQLHQSEIPKTSEFMTMFKDLLTFFEKQSLSSVSAKSKLYVKRERHDANFFLLLLKMLEETRRFENEQDQIHHIHRIFLWYKRNRGVLHAFASQLDDSTTKSKIRMAPNAMQYSKSFIPIEDSSDNDNEAVDGDQETPLPSNRKMERMALRSQQSSVFSGSLLSGLDGTESVTTPDTEDLNRIQMHTPGVLIPGATERIILQKPSLRAVDLQPNYSKAEYFNRARPQKEYRIPPEYYLDKWQDYQRAFSQGQEFLSKSQFYGRYGSIMSKRYSTNPLPELQVENRTDDVIKNYAEFHENLFGNLSPNQKSICDESSLEDFYFAAEDCKNRALKSARVPTANRVEHLMTPKQPSRDAYVTLSGNESVEAISGNINFEHIKTIVDNVKDDMINTKEMMAHPPSRGFRRPDIAIDPNCILPTETFIISRQPLPTMPPPPTPAEGEKRLIMVPGATVSQKLLAPTPYEDYIKDNARIQPAQRQTPRTAGGATSRGNRPYTQQIQIDMKDRWGSRTEADGNYRSKSAANHPFYVIPQDVLKSLVNTKSLSSKSNQPWWKSHYRISKSDNIPKKQATIKNPFAVPNLEFLSISQSLKA